MARRSWDGGKGHQAMEKQMSSKELPLADSIQDLAQFWDSHELTDFADDLEEVSAQVFKRETAGTIQLSRKEADEDGA
jgi:hypothetical protein